MHTVLHFIGKVLWYIPWGIGMATIIAVIGNSFKHDDSNEYEEDNDYEDE